MDESVKTRLHQFIRSKGLRSTSQRDIIVDMIFSTDDHFTADELCERLRKTQSRASRATVYRTISLLVEAGLLHEIDLGEDQKTYDPNFLESPAHNHLICIDCGKVIEFEDEGIRIMTDCAATRIGFRSQKQTLKVEACCEKLRLNGQCQNLIEARISGKRLPKQR